VLLSISSPAFKEGESIPLEYSFDGLDVSPQLDWHFIPKETQSLVLIFDDPDAPNGTFTHWVLFNIPPNINGLSKSIPLIPKLADGTIQGSNDFGVIGYRGPCPPPGFPHRYSFKLYAVDKQLNLQAGSSKNKVEDAIRGHILSQGQLTGIYQR
jgi:Raf kinase inhibitor-like YbhB/YbcL family protein